MEKSFVKSVRAHFREYCSHTSVHGFQYIGEKKRSLFERIWWSIIFVICLSACTVSIYAVYKKWEQSPVIVNFANRGTPIYTIPFPAVTICPESKSDQRKFNFTEVMQKMEDGLALTAKEETYFEYMSLICNYYKELNYTNNETFSSEFYDVMDTVKPTFPIRNCSFLSLSVDCKEAFQPIITEEGVCYTFNMLNREEIFREEIIHYKDYHKTVVDNVTLNSSWTLQDGYKDDAGLGSYPMRAYLSGAKYGFQFDILTPNDGLDYACRSSVQGYKMLLHTPMTIPRPRHKFLTIPLDQAVVGAVRPVMITTSNRVKAYSPKARRCYFSGERHLKYFKNYTSSNCALECVTNYTLATCGCVDFYMPRTNGTEICGTGNIECMIEAEKEMHIITLVMKLEKEIYNKYMKNKIFECDCLPVCSDLTFEVETTQNDWNWNMLLRARRSLPRVNNSHLSSVTLFFKSGNFITSERNELYGPLDFLSNFGGLLGLFTGFSILSLMEIIYFLTIRIIFNKRLYGHWTGAES